MKNKIYIYPLLIIFLAYCSPKKEIKNTKIELNDFEEIIGNKISSFDNINSDGLMYSFNNDTLFEIDLNTQKLKKTYYKFDEEKLKLNLANQFKKDSINGLINGFDKIWELENYSIENLKAGTDNKITGILKMDLISSVKGSPAKTYYSGIVVFDNKNLDFIIKNELVDLNFEDFRISSNNFNIFNNSIIYFTTKYIGTDSVIACIKWMDLENKRIKEISNFEFNKYMPKDQNMGYLAFTESIQNENKIFYTNNEQIWSIDKKTKNQELILNLEPHFKDSLIKISHFAIEKNKIYLQISGCHKDSSNQKFKTNKLIYQYDIQTKELNIPKKLDEYGVIKLVRDNKLYIIKENEEKIWVDIL